MGRYIIACVFALLFLSSCHLKTAQQEHLPPKDMGKILLDINLAEAYSGIAKDSTIKMVGGKNADSLAVFYKDIFARHHITKQQFDNSMAWYKEHTDELDSVYNKMIPEIEKLDAKNNGEKK